MHRTKFIVSLFFLAMISVACIKQYIPEIADTDTSKYVVNGEVNNESGYQKVSISKSSPLKEPGYVAVPNCYVVIIDNDGNNFVMNDQGDGNYLVFINPVDIIPGSAYKVDIITPDGMHLVSDYDSVSNSPAVDSVYFVQKPVPSYEPNTFLNGVQYYINLNGSSGDSRFYRWEITETWEYHAERALQWYYDGSVHHVWPPDSSKMVCWKTQLVKNIYTLSTQGLAENKYRGLPLNYVDTKSTRLAYGYSLLIKQYALSENAYNFWDKMRVNSSGNGGLYEKQPMAIRGNLHNLTHPDEEVLGFFSAASIKAKRVFTRPVPGLVLDYPNYCSPQRLLGFSDITPYEYPAVLDGDEDSYYMWILNVECYDCTVMGGTVYKPDFWPN
jgi:hypothetical protein